jgi:hypothetical protein
MTAVPTAKSPELIVDQGLAPVLALSVPGAGASQFPSAETGEPVLL